MYKGRQRKKRKIQPTHCLHSFISVLSFYSSTFCWWTHQALQYDFCLLLLSFTSRVVIISQIKTGFCLGSKTQLHHTLREATLLLSWEQSSSVSWAQLASVPRTAVLLIEMPSSALSALWHSFSESNRPKPSFAEEDLSLNHKSTQRTKQMPLRKVHISLSGW